MKKITISNFLTSAHAALDKSQGYVVTLLLLIAMVLPAAAQNGTYLLDHHNDNAVQVNNSGKYDVRTPFLTGKRNSKLQYLYLASELAVAPNLLSPSAEAKTIKTIGFYVTFLPFAQPATIANMKIRMGNTTLENFGTSSTGVFGDEWGTPNIENDPLLPEQDQVYGDFEHNVPTFIISATGLVTIELGAGFVWDGHSNILIEFSMSMPSSQGNNAYIGDANGQNVQVEGSSWASPAPYLVRGAHTKNKNILTGTQGYEMIYSTGANNTVTTPPGNAKVMDVSERRFRPNIRFQMDCASFANLGGVTVKDSETSVGGCRKFVLKVDNGMQAYGTTYQWESSTTEDFATAVPLPLGNMQSFTLTQENIIKYYRRVSTCGGDNRYSSTYTVDAAPVNTYTHGGGWSGGTPGVFSDNMLNINSGDPIISSNTKACGCAIGAGANLTLDSGSTFQVDGGLKVHPAGSFTVNDGASLIQVDPNAANTGVITVRRNSQPMVAYDFTYWSSPVQGQNLGSFSPHTLTDKFYKWSPTVQNWVLENVANNFTPGIGYIIRAPQATFPGAAYTGAPTGPYTGTYVHNGVFTGAANNGTISTPITLGTGKTNFIANPYPSPLDLNEFYTANSAKLDGTFLFWTHNTPIGGMAYTGNDYAMYTVGTGGIAAISGGTIPTQFLAVGQSVQVKAKSGTGVAPSTVTYKNSMRRAATVSSPFFKVNSNVSVDANASNKDRLWLNLTTATAFKQVLVGYIDGATTNFDSNYDGDAVAGAAISFYSIADGHLLAIQGRPAFNVNDQVILGFSTNAAGSHRIELPQTEGVFGAQAVFLEDKLTNVTHNLKDGGYNFNSAAGTFNNRFVLKYVGLTSNLGVATNNVNENLQDFIAYKQATDLVIDAGSAEIDMVKVYDLSGRMLIQQKGMNAKDVVISNPNWASQVLIVQMHTADKIVLTKKVVF